MNNSERQRTFLGIIIQKCEGPSLSGHDLSPEGVVVLIVEYSVVILGVTFCGVIGSVTFANGCRSKKKNKQSGQNCIFGNLIYSDVNRLLN
jgi:hypothetical protein